MAVYSRYDGEYTFRLHIISSELRYEISKRIAVVNYLNSMPEAAEEYYAAASADKREPDGTAYISGSAEDIEKLEAKALEWSESQAHLGTCMSIGMCLGMCLGMCFGSVFDNISVGMCFGMGIGLCFGSVFGSRKPSGSDKGQKK